MKDGLHHFSVKMLDHVSVACLKCFLILLYDSAKIIGSTREKTVLISMLRMKTRL